VLGFAYAAAGCLASAIVTYLIGAHLGKDVLRDLLGPRLDRIRRRIVQQGVIAIAAIRLVPVAPFTFVNLVAGASQIRLHDYLLGTILGMAPGILAMSALGHQVFEMWHHPTLANVALLIGAAIGWIALSIGVQVLVSKFRRADT
jgi:phospholipase D1/2